MKDDCCATYADYGPNPYVANIEQMAVENSNFRTAIWTGCHMQMTVMYIPPCGEIGLEVHPVTDQFIRVEQGKAVAKLGKCEEYPDFCRSMRKGDAVFIPAGTWHNVLNEGRQPLWVSVIYAPSNHPRGTVHRTKKEAELEEY
ncbi:MAG: cupin domain-containing protein [Lachnospiraceae bacterium]|nr:cupin domain-containing protein [Lachnospiraceae bacterium]